MTPALSLPEQISSSRALLNCKSGDRAVACASKDAMLDLSFSRRLLLSLMLFIIPGTVCSFSALLDSKCSICALAFRACACQIAVSTFRRTVWYTL